MSSTRASLIVSRSKGTLPDDLNAAIAAHCMQALSDRGAFTIALSGGSLPDFMTGLADHFNAHNIDPQFHSWHVLLADERCVAVDHADSNLGAIRKTFLASASGIPDAQVYGIDTSLLEENDPSKNSTKAIAEQYEATLRRVLQEHSGGMLDLALLGFGPDGHTCSLFPNHALLQEHDKWVAPIEDSPKPPACRITLTLPVLNQRTRSVIVCGAGESKGPILQQVFLRKPTAVETSLNTKGKSYKATLSDPPPFPCAMVRPAVADDTLASLTWIVDEDAFQAAGLD